MSTKLSCLHCPYWVESSILGMPWAEREMAAHVRAKHPSRPTLVPIEFKEHAGSPCSCGDANCASGLLPGSVQSDVAALDVREAPQDVIAALVLDWRFESGARVSIRAPHGAKLTVAEAEAFCETVRGLVETPVQEPGKEGAS